jgi:hypothetical protein
MQHTNRVVTLVLALFFALTASTGPVHGMEKKSKKGREAQPEKETLGQDVDEERRNRFQRSSWSQRYTTLLAAVNAYDCANAGRHQAPGQGTINLGEAALNLKQEMELWLVADGENNLLKKNNKWGAFKNYLEQVKATGNVCNNEVARDLRNFLSGTILRILPKTAPTTQTKYRGGPRNRNKDK